MACLKYVQKRKVPPSLNCTNQSLRTVDNPLEHPTSNSHYQVLDTHHEGLAPLAVISRCVVPLKSSSFPYRAFRSRRARPPHAQHMYMGRRRRGVRTYLTDPPQALEEAVEVVVRLDRCLVLRAQRDQLPLLLAIQRADHTQAVRFRVQHVVLQEETAEAVAKRTGTGAQRLRAERRRRVLPRGWRTRCQPLRHPWRRPCGRRPSSPRPHGARSPSFSSFVFASSASSNDDAALWGLKSERNQLRRIKKTRLD